MKNMQRTVCSMYKHQDNHTFSFYTFFKRFSFSLCFALFLRKPLAAHRKLWWVHREMVAKILCLKLRSCGTLVHHMSRSERVSFGNLWAIGNTVKVKNSDTCSKLCPWCWYYIAPLCRNSYSTSFTPAYASRCLEPPYWLYLFPNGLCACYVTTTSPVQVDTPCLSSHVYCLSL